MWEALAGPLHHLRAQVNADPIPRLHGRQEITGPAADLEDGMTRWDRRSAESLQFLVVVPALAVPAVHLRRQPVEVLLDRDLVRRERRHGLILQTLWGPAESHIVTGHPTIGLFGSCQTRRPPGRERAQRGRPRRPKVGSSCFRIWTL